MRRWALAGVAVLVGLVAAGAALLGRPRDHAPPRCPSGMAAIPGGVFAMGSLDGEPGERPVHAVDVASFCLDATEVTVRAYGDCVRAGRCTPPHDDVWWPGISDGLRALWTPACNRARADREDHPVNCVDWAQADAYCRAQGKRLPTEAEWEYAARGGEEARRFPWGDAPPSSSRLNGCGAACAAALAARGAHPRALYADEDPFLETAPVARFPPSRWGVYDLAGNVWEWTSSRECGYGRFRLCLLERKRVHRGGGWSDGELRMFRGAHRDSSDPRLRDADLGIRCAR